MDWEHLATSGCATVLLSAVPQTTHIRLPVQILE